MSLATNVSTLATRVATECKSLRTLINGNTADLTALHTTAQANLVAAINEVADSASAATGINDTTTTTTTTWSSQKISDTSTADRDRANHTGVQPASTITGLATVATTGTYTDLTGTVPQSALPAVALTEFLGAVADEASMLALTGQRGDWATRTDLGTDWQLIADDATLLASWREMTYPASPVSSVNGRTGAVAGLAEASDVGDTATVFVDIFTAGLV